MEITSVELSKWIDTCTQKLHCLALKKKVYTGGFPVRGDHVVLTVTEVGMLDITVTDIFILKVDFKL